MAAGLQMTSEETLPILKEVFMTMTLEQHPLKTWVFVTNSTDVFILGLDQPESVVRQTPPQPQWSCPLWHSSAKLVETVASQYGSEHGS